LAVACPFFDRFGLLDAEVEEFFLVPFVFNAALFAADVLRPATLLAERVVEEDALRAGRFFEVRVLGALAWDPLTVSITFAPASRTASAPPAITSPTVFTTAPAVAATGSVTRCSVLFRFLV
jgi:hypothetical protein